MNFLCNFTKNQGRFLFWRWELWQVGGGAGVTWYFLNKEIFPSRFSLLWIIFKLQNKKVRGYSNDN